MKAGKILHIILVALIVLFMCGHFLLNNTKIQQEAAQHVERIAQSSLGTNVSVGRVQFVYPFGITVDGLTVFDEKNDTLANIGSVTLRLKPSELIRNRISISSVRIKSPDIRLSADSIGAVPNYAFLAELFNSPSSNMSLRANSILVRNGTLRYDILDSPSTDSLFNFNHVAVNGLTANLSLKAKDTDSLAFIVRKLSFSEQSGFKLSKAKGAVAIGSDSTWLYNFRLSTPQSDLIAERLRLDIGFNRHLRGLPCISGSLLANVTGKDFMAFDPRLASLTDKIEFAVKGNENRNGLSIETLSLQSENREIEMAFNGVLHLKDGKLTGCTNANAYGNLSTRFCEWLETQASGFGLVIPPVFKTLGQTSFNVTANYCPDSSLKSDATLICKAGTATCSIEGINGNYKGVINGKDINLKTVTGNNDLGKCRFSVIADITKFADGLAGSFNGSVGSLVYKNYAYQNIFLTGSFKPGFIISDLNFRDENGALSLNAALADNEVKSVSINIAADSLNLAAYNIAGKDSMCLCANFTAGLSGRNVDDISGALSLDQLFYGDAAGDWYMENLTASITNDEDNRNISVIGDFVNITLTGDYRLSTLPYSLSKAFSDVLPTIGKMLESKMGISDRKAIPRNSFTINGRLDNTDFMEAVFHKPLVLNSPATMQLAFNDTEGSCKGDIWIPSFSVAGESIYNGLITMNSVDGTCRAEITGLYGESGPNQTNLRASLMAFTDIVRTQYYWNNESGDIKGYAKTLGQFFKYDRKYGLKYMCLLDSTDILVNGTPWKLALTDIRSDSGRVSITGFKIRNGLQHFYADGVISPDSSDILKISMSRIDLDHTLSMLHANSSNFKGTASGEMNIAGVTGSPAFFGHFDVDGFEFMDSYHGHLRADCRWNKDLERVDINGIMKDEDIEETKVNGYYSPENKYLDIDIDAEHTDLHFLNRWTTSTFRELGGRAFGKLKLFGPLDRLDLTGQAILEDGYFIQDDINTTFRIKHDTLWFEPGKMLFKNVVFYDEMDHDGMLTCILDHDYFHNWRVDMTADLSNMQVYYLPKTEMNSFFATVFADGSMGLKYDQDKGLAISANARTSPGTKLGYNPTSGSVADYNFLTIVDRDTFKVHDNEVAAIIPAQSKNSSKTTYDLNIECSEDALIDMSFNSLSGLFRGSGNISVTYTPQEGTMLNGIYNLSYGQCSLSFEDIIRKNFALREGSYVRFNGAPNETEINLSTYHNVNSVSIYDLDPSASSSNNVRVRCLMDVTGNVQDPQLKFDIDMPNGTSEEKEILASATATEEQRNNQFLYLLTIGRFYTMDYTGGAASTMTPSAMESLVNSTVSGQINNLLSSVLDNENITLSSNVSASSYLSNDATNLNNKELEGILEAHLLNNRLLLNGNFGYRENTINNTSNFIGDFEVRYLLLPRQGISIKGYNKTNDKYFSKATLTTQGVGLVFERDF